eukprot:CAMPEP_0117444486 /NCGR_PEP_ID=MMETSP0759-20121206/5268_1 /TAXON_ID=63605 /ORGANISM="Percolomonas cosmopolitus, Strain WS" /LENGTH=122 /DNA_ID=CAMNT_0005236559 /DNA_START=260 /DNA_END=628 /DNA_ORIENTATION=-
MNAFHHGSTLPIYHQNITRHAIALSRETERLSQEMGNLSASGKERGLLVRNITRQMHEGVADLPCNPSHQDATEVLRESPLPQDARRGGSLARVIQERLQKESLERRKRQEHVSNQGDLRVE